MCASVAACAHASILAREPLLSPRPLHETQSKPQAWLKCKKGSPPPQHILRERLRPYSLSLSTKCLSKLWGPKTGRNCMGAAHLLLDGSAQLDAAHVLANLFPEGLDAHGLHQPHQPRLLPVAAGPEVPAGAGAEHDTLQPALFAEQPPDCASLPCTGISRGSMRRSPGDPCERLA